MARPILQTLDYQLRENSIVYSTWALFIQSPPPYYTDGTKWYYPDNSGRFHTMNEASLEARLVAFGLSRKKAEDSPTECEMARTFLQENHAVVYAGMLAGFATGLHTLPDGSRILVTSETRPITPAPGEWPTLRAIFEGLLMGTQTDQTPYFYGWLKIFLQAYFATLEEGITSQAPMAGHTSVFCGPAGCGKTLVKSILIAMFGGRSASPYAYMLGETNFNQEIVEAPILEIDDEAASKDPRDRQRLAAKIKGLVAGATQRVHAKYQKPVTLLPCQRLLVCLNDEPANLLVLPVIEKSIEDKLMLFRVQRAKIPMPTETVEGRNTFWKTLMSELPAFVHFLLHEFEIPVALRSGRFGVKHFHHPDLLGAISELDTDEERVLEMIDDLFARNEFFVVYDAKQKKDLGEENRPAKTDPWVGTASRLEGILKSRYRERGVDRIFKYASSGGMLLSSLAKNHPDRVQRGTKVRGYLRWTLFPPRNEAGE